MTTVTVAQEITTVREEFGGLFSGLRDDMAAHYWEGFGEIAARYRGARDELRGQRDFRAAIQGLRADARGDLNNPEFRRVTESANVPPMPSRAPWATMPTDGSGRLTLPERILYSVIGGACAAVLLILGFLVSGAGSSPDAPATDTRNAGQVVTDADLITQGGYWSWEVAESCGMRVPAECDKTLREVNAAAERYGVRVWEDGTISPLGRQY